MRISLDVRQFTVVFRLLTYAPGTAYLCRMSNDDTTTKPTIETVLEKINTLGEQLTGQLTELRSGQDELRTDVAELRGDVAELRAGQVELRSDMEELKAGQMVIEDKLDALNDNILTVQGKQRGFQKRLQKLEAEPS